jgi:hypothetical protein
MVAFALRADGWYLRSDIIWNKPNPMPESVTDRPTKSHEYVFLLSKGPRYFYDADAIRETFDAPDPRGGNRNARPGIDVNGGDQANGGSSAAGRNGGRNKRSVWTVATQPLRRRALRHLPGEADRAVHPRRYVTEGVRGVRGTVATGRGWREAYYEGDDGPALNAQDKVGNGTAEADAARRTILTRLRVRSAGSRHAPTTTTPAPASSSTRSRAPAPPASSPSATTAASSAANSHPPTLIWRVTGSSPTRHSSTRTPKPHDPSRPSKAH